LFDLPNNAAVLVDTVQVYIRLINYDDFRLDAGRETPESHARGLAVLHTLYGAADRVVEGIGGQRVDYHGARLHAVVIEPRGEASIQDRIAAALELAEQMAELARLGGRQFLGELGGQLRFRIGIDVGPCVAINSGRSDEREPMFVGPSANHAAKLAAGNAEGIFLSDRVRAASGLRRAATLTEERASAATSVELGALRGTAQDGSRITAASGRLERWIVEERERTWTPLVPENFKFHQHTPPLRSIDYALLSPSRSIRMPVAVIFADLDRYTAYIDRCMADGGLEEAVRLLHVIRSEMNAVVQDDFRGRKVRFIGDCILALIAEGEACEVDLKATIIRATLCAGALRSSFDLCGDIMPEARKLGLAIGFETGETPVSRIGIRGDRAVRVASSLAVRASEACQQDCDGRQTKIGPNAYANADVAVKSLFGPGQITSDLCYDDVATGVDGRGVAAAVVGISAGRTATAVLAGGAAAAVARPARAYLSE
jgi:class 3 adenylate cyclase